MKRKQSLQLNIAVLLVAVLVSFGCIEIGLRIAGISYPAFYEAHDQLGYKPIPYAEGWFRTEGESFVSMNAHGFRDEDHTYEKPDNTYRILVLGDSFSEAKHVSLDQTYWKKIENELATCENMKDKNIEVINLGVDGYGTAQEYIMLEEYGWKYDPDFVLLQFFADNDVWNNARNIHRDIKRPYLSFDKNTVHISNEFHLLKKGGAVFSPYRLALRKLGTNIRVAQLVDSALSQLHIQENHQGHTNLDHIPEKILQVYSEPTDPVWITGWETTEKILALIANATKEKEVPFLVFTTSTPLQIYPDKEKRDALALRSDADLFYAETRLEKLEKQNNIEVMSLGREMQPLADATSTFFHGFENTVLGTGHWNEEGHHIAGTLLSQKICNLLHSTYE